MNNITELEKLVTEFRKNILRKDINSDNTCYSICYPLSIYLQSKGIKNKLGMGVFNKENNSKNGTHHYWIYINDDKDVIDPTIEQFKIKEMTNIFIGNITKHEDYFIHITDNQKERLEGAFNLWKSTYEGYEKEQLEKFLIVNTRAFEILKKEIDTKYDNDYKKYFDGINEIKAKYSTLDEFKKIFEEF